MSDAQKKKSRRKKRAAKRSKQHSDDSNRCIVCFSRVEASERFRPCNCTFGFVHRQCIKEWINVGRSRCRICSHVYDADRRNNVCFLCAEKCDGAFLPCACKHIVVHQQCLNNQYAAGQHSCRFCGSSYATKVRSRFICTSSRCRCFRFQFVLHALWILFYLALFTFLVAPSDFVSMIDSRPRRTVNSGGSGFLFPGNPTYGIYFVDILYVIALIATVVGLVMWGCVGLYGDCRRSDCRRVSSTVKNTPQWKIQLLPICVALCFLLLHLFGNAHYQIYCALGVISSQNCFWMINWQSFITSLAGIIIVLGPLALIAAIILLLKWLFFQKQQIAVVLPVSSAQRPDVK